MSEFRDQVVFVTGACGKLGEIVTRQFLDAGAHVVAVDLQWVSPPDSERVLPIQLDLGDPAQCRKAVDIAIERFGRIDVLIHLVGGYHTGDTIAETTDETWFHMMNVNLHSTFKLCREVLPHMLLNKRGRIIAIGAKSGVDPVYKMGAYHVSKAAVHALIRSIGRECKATGVTANAILPSIIDTEINRTEMPDADYSKWVQPVAIAQLIQYLASGSAADINGALIPIYGG